MGSACALEEKEHYEEINLKIEKSEKLLKSAETAAICWLNKFQYQFEKYNARMEQLRETIYPRESSN